MTHAELTLREFLDRGVALVRDGLISVRITDQWPTKLDHFTWTWKRLKGIVPADFMPGCDVYTIGSREAALEILNAGAMVWARKRMLEE